MTSALFDGLVRYRRRHPEVVTQMVSAAPPETPAFDGEQANVLQARAPEPQHAGGGWRDRLAVAGVAGALLGAELCITRFFAWMVRADDVLMVLAVAVAGCGLGAALVAAAPRMAATTQAVVPLVCGLCLCAIAGVAGCFIALPSLLVAGGLLWGLLFLPAFACGGAAISLLIARAGARASRLYAADLAGAAAAALLASPVIDVGGPLTGLAIFAGAALVLAVVTTNPSRRGIAQSVVCLAACAALAMPPAQRMAEDAAEPPALALLSAVISTGDTDDIAAKTLWYERAAFGERRRRVIDTVWPFTGRTDVVTDDDDPDVETLWYDGAVPAPVFRWNGDETVLPARAAVLPTVVPYAMRPIRSLLALGAGGGLDVLTARTHGVARIDAVDLNTAIPVLLARPALRDFHGGVYTSPKVTFTLDDARSFAARAAPGSYDLVTLSLTEANTAEMGSAAPESFVQTAEGCRAFLRLLSDRGMLMFVTESGGDLYGPRLLVTCAPALMELTGATEPEALGHVAFATARKQIGSYGTITLVSRAPFSDDELLRMRSEAARLDLELALPRASPSDPHPIATLVSDAATRGLTDWGPARIDATTDDRPFFFDISFALDETWWSSLFGTAGVVALLFLALVFITRRPRGTRARLGEAPLLAAAAVCGAGFMITETLAVHRFMLVVGTATLTMATTVCGLLLGAALTSWFTRDARNPVRTALVCAAVAALGAVASARVPGVAIEALLATPRFAHVALATLWSLALGACIGGAFPQILRELERRAGARGVAAGFAVNAAFALPASIAALMLARSQGLTVAFECGGLCYAATAMLLLLPQYANRLFQSGEAPTARSASL